MLKVIGIDLESGSSPSSSRQAKYSVVIMNEKNEIEYKSEEVTLARLIRIIWEFRPNILALDNIYELGNDERALRKIISLLPSDLSIVQVTFVSGEFKDIKELAKPFFNDIQGKLSPSKTAYLCAFLAIKGIGTQVKAIETKTKIIVSRGRSLGPGGMSQNRYKRHIRGLVLRVTKKIREKLDAHGFDYDLVVKRSKNGIERATFIVYSPREALYGIIKKMKGHDLVVEIKPVFKTKIKFEDKKGIKKRPLIVGIDPGIEVGISAIDLYGNIVFVTSKRGIDRDEIINIISGYGYPIIIATDVQEVPETVKKIAATTGSRLYWQSKPLTVEDKQRIVFNFVKGTDLKIENTHIRDSLAAAITAYYELESKLRQAQSIISRLELDVDEEEVLECIAKENSVSSCIEMEIEKSIASDFKDIVEEKKSVSSSSIPEKIESSERKRELVELKRELERYRSLVKRLIIEKEEIERKLEELKRNINMDIQRDRKVYELELQLDDRNRTIKNLQSQIEFYKNNVSDLEEIIENISNGKYLIIKSGENKGKLRYGEDEEVYLMGEKTNKGIAKYVGKGFIVIDAKLLEDLEILAQEKSAFEASKIDLHKIINEYRTSRVRIK